MWLSAALSWLSGVRFPSWGQFLVTQSLRKKNPTWACVCAQNSGMYLWGCKNGQGSIEGMLQG